MQTLIPLVLFLLPLAYSPGPGNMFFAANGARFGVKSTLRANAGYHVATWLVTMAIGFGFVGAMAQYPQAFSALKTAGAAYVLWLAWKLFRAGPLMGQEKARPAGFVDGAILLLLNPKAYVIITLMFSQFLTSDGGVAAIILITTVFTLNNLSAFLVWTILGDFLARQFRSASGARILNTVFSVMLALVAIWMLVF
ncbi:MAG: LysE family translocator [Rhodobacteraceae bacterium]|nr:LysE family translocator [Paracoccaceae bacterium]